MIKNKTLKSIIFVALFLVSFSFVKAESTSSNLPDNVKITTSSDGTSTTIVVNSKPGFITNVQTSCVNGKCTNNTTSKEITSQDIQKMQDDMKKREEELNKFWKMQEELFKQQQKMFQDVFDMSWF